MRAEVESMLVELKGLMNAAADKADLNEMNKLRDRREALNRILDATTTDD